MLTLTGRQRGSAHGDAYRRATVPLLHVRQAVHAEIRHEDALQDCAPEAALSQVS